MLASRSPEIWMVRDERSSPSRQLTSTLIYAMMKLQYVKLHKFQLPVFSESADCLQVRNQPRLAVQPMGHVNFVSQSSTIVLVPLRL